MKYTHFKVSSNPIQNNKTTLTDILSKKKLTMVSGQYFDIKQPCELYSHTEALTREIYRLYKTPSGYEAIDNFMATIRRNIPAQSYQVPYDNKKLRKLFDIALDLGVLRHCGFEEKADSPEFTQICEFVPEYIHYITYFCVVFDAIRSLIERGTHFEELFFDVTLQDATNHLAFDGADRFKVDIMYRVGGIAYFVIIMQQSNYQKFQRKILDPVNRLRSNVSIVLHPELDIREFSENVSKHMAPTTSMPRIIHFGQKPN